MSNGPPSSPEASTKKKDYGLRFQQIYREVLHPLHHKEAERSSEAQHDHQQQLPRQHQVTAVEEGEGCAHRLATKERRVS